MLSTHVWISITQVGEQQPWLQNKESPSSQSLEPRVLSRQEEEEKEEEAIV